MKVFSRAEWVAECAKTNPATVGASMSLGSFAALCNRVGQERHEQYPGVCFSNRRYVAHLEQCLEAGAIVPPEYIATVADTDIQFDGHALPLLQRARQDTGRKRAS
jgi:hypothetical protein